MNLGRHAGSEKMQGQKRRRGRAGVMPGKGGEPGEGGTPRWPAGVRGTLATKSGNACADRVPAQMACPDRWAGQKGVMSQEGSNASEGISPGKGVMVWRGGA